MPISTEPSDPRARPDLLEGRVLADLDPDRIRRYGRHLTLPDVGLDGQRRLEAARVLLVGVGGLGSPLAMYLAAAGVGTLGIVDHDRVELTNLQRQLLYGSDDLGRAKVEAARQRLGEINPHVRVEAHPERFDAGNALELVERYDVVADGSDNFPTRYLVNDACMLRGKPNVWGAVLRFEGQVSVFWGGQGPCYRCLFPEPPPAGSVPSCAEGGVLGVLPGIVGTLQATEVIKLLLGIGEPLIGRLLLIDALTMRLREVRIGACGRYPVCAEERGLVSYDDLACAEDAAGRGSDDMKGGDGMNGGDDRGDGDGDGDGDGGGGAAELPFDITVETLAAWRREGRPLILLDVREPREHDIALIEGARLIPLRELPERLDELDPDALTVVHCHHGPRSSHAVEYLRAQGFERAVNLAGGIDAWSLRIDPEVPRY